MSSPRFFLCCGAVLLALAPARAAGPEVVSAEKIWDRAPHNAFTDLIRWHDKWYCTFREAEAHVGGNGKLRVLDSAEGKAWESVALVAEDGTDLRDPKLSVTPDDRLMIVAGGSVYEGKTLKGFQPRVAFSADGRKWTAPRRVLSEGEWLWRVTWHGGTAYGVSYGSGKLKLFAGTDGVKYDLVTVLGVRGEPNETTLRFLPDGEMVALVRRDGAGESAVVGRSRPPYKEWAWKETKHRVGGPNFLRLPDGTLWAAGRSYPGGAKTALARMTADGGYEPALTLPSGGDTSYPGLVWHDGLLWMSYYSSHESKSAIYLARIRVPLETLLPAADDKLPDYRPVPGWPKMPDDVTLGPVSAVATDSSDRVYVLHRGKRPLLVFDRDGTFLRSWGDDHLKTPHGLRIDGDDNVWVTDIGNHQVLKFDAAGKLLLALGKKGEPGTGPDQFDRPTDVAVAPTGEFYVSDGYGNSRVLKCSKDGKLLKQWGRKGRGKGEFDLPHAICLDARGRVYVGDRENNRVQVFGADGQFLDVWKESGAPYGLFLAGGRLFVADGRAGWVKVLDADGRPLGRFGEKGDGPGQFRLPHMLCVDSHGAVYVAEVDGKRVQKFVPDAPPPEQQALFTSGEGGYHTYRIPALVVTTKGTLLAFCEGRKKSRGDSGDIDLLLRRSTDGGRTWGEAQVVWDDGDNTCGNPCPVVDGKTGTVWLLMTHNLGGDTEARILGGTGKGTRTVWVTRSDDDGATWARPVEITKDVKKADWTWYATGPGVGIQTKAGRLVVPCDNSVKGSKERQAHVIISDDGGKSWRLGGVVGPDCNESQVVELADGALLLNMRSYRGTNRRLVAVSKDGGETFSRPEEDKELVEPVCQASVLRLPGRGGGVLFSNPASTRRERLTVRLSTDEGKTWPHAKMLHEGPAAYSCLAALPDGTIACLYERGEKGAYETITLARFSRGWLTGAAK